MQLLDGKEISQAILDDLRQEVANLKGEPPHVCFVRVGEDPASVSYVNTKHKTAEALGIRSSMRVFPAGLSQAELLAEIDRLNADPSVHGILVQAPLPKPLQEREIFNRVHPDKDVDGFNAVNLGRLVQEDPQGFVACTPAGIVEMLRRKAIPTEGKHVVVLGRSVIVGKPAGLLFMRRQAFANATVTVCHSQTQDLPALTRQADILIAAIGKARFVTADMVKEGAVVIDVGINRVEDPSAKRGYRVVGDVDFDHVAPKCSYISPVPGGVGLMTVALLMSNTVKAYRQNLPHAGT